MRWLAILLLTLGLTPLCAQQSSVEEIVSSIEPEKWYLGSDVRVAMNDLLTIQAEEMALTAFEASEAAEKVYVETEAKLRAEVALLERHVLAWRISALAAGAVVAILVIVQVLPHSQ